MDLATEQIKALWSVRMKAEQSRNRVAPLRHDLRGGRALRSGHMDGIVYLDPTGKRLKEEAVSSLQDAMQEIEKCMDSLRQEKGIGTEFCIDSLEGLYAAVYKMKTALNRL